jgi:hypothetical protein
MGVEMSQLDRQHAYQQMRRKAGELLQHINDSAATVEERARMRQLLAHLLNDADRATGGEECRP